MSLKKLLILAGVVAIAAGLVGAWPGRTTAAPLAQDNLLQNPGFEMPYTDNQQANGWDRYRIKIEKPTDASALQYSVAANFNAETNPSGRFPELIHGGSTSQHIGQQQDPWIAGVRQVVSNIPPNSQVSFCAFARIFANNENYGKAPSVNSYEGRAQVGIYPDGDVGPDTAGIVWSPEVNPHDNWQQLCTSATVGASGKVTVFTHNDWRGYAAVHLDAWWDDASLTVQGQAQATTQPQQPQQPQATTPPQPQVQETPNAQGAIVHTVVAGDTLFALSFQYNVPLDTIYALNGLNSQSILSIGEQIIIKPGPGTQVPSQSTVAPTAAPQAAQPTPAGTPNAAQTPAAAETTPAVEPTATAAQVATNTNKLCVLAFNDANGDGIRQPDEAPVAGAVFKIIDAQGSAVETYTSTESDPHCITNLAAGSYTVDVQPAPGTTATSDKRWGVALTSGSTVNINFGSEGGGTTGANAQSGTAAEKSSGGSSIGGLLGGAVGLILLLVAGVLGAFIIARRRA